MMATPTILELRHAECESPGAYGAGLVDVASIHTVRAWRDPIPDDPAPYAAIIVMGGPMGTDDGPSIPWIDDEIALLRRAIAAGTPIWGACLGSQLLASALGAEITTGPAPEMGIVDITLTDDGLHDPVWSGHGDTTFPALQWHFDTFAVPEGATLLASSAAYPNQLFRHGSCYGIQFHLEVDAVVLEDWLAVDDYRTELIDLLGTDGVAHTVEEMSRIEGVTVPLAMSAIRRWFDLFVA
ncbi:type 1 glutamine amidotransferase [Gordonia insulae]|uniref:GMP synthase [glutamine-hydrolyzing] n=1 Tax=Gordonia insulae TaxID=2420509 RepID=A0A3G8JII3_9ACTN|nr:type 1 glutamine amidotransferase [Gordonia insulae]AZG44897.1 GMP synthase [glutamine-hydrolyzing] [Gordonia insulae]